MDMDISDKLAASVKENHGGKWSCLIPPVIKNFQAKTPSRLVGRTLLVQINPEKESEQVQFFIELPGDVTNKELAFLKWLTGEIVDQSGLSINECRMEKRQVHPTEPHP